jgi:hypothetical protein
MVAFKNEGTYMAARVTKVMTHNLERFDHHNAVVYLVKTTDGQLHSVSDVLPMRTPEESEHVVRVICGF